MMIEVIAHQLTPKTMIDDIENSLYWTTDKMKEYIRDALKRGFLIVAYRQDRMCTISPTSSPSSCHDDFGRPLYKQAEGL